VENLNRVGAFARIEPGQLPATDSSRQKDQIELMPDLTDQGVIADRDIRVCEVSFDKLTDIYAEMCEAMPNIQVVDTKVGKAPKLMLVLDHPFNDYQEPVQQHSYREFVMPSLSAAGLKFDDIVLAYVARRPKAKTEKEVPQAERAVSQPFLLREIEVMKPPVIVLLGNASIKTFFPDIKKPSEAIGHKAFSSALDATVIVGFNPTRLYHNPEMTEKLTEVFQSAAELVGA
jgi:DNA polymerase-3 subunit alpha